MEYESMGRVKSVGSNLNRGRIGIDIVTLVLLLKMRVRVVLWNMRVWAGRVW